MACRDSRRPLYLPFSEELGETFSVHSGVSGDGVSGANGVVRHARSRDRVALGTWMPPRSKIPVWLGLIYPEQSLGPLFRQARIARKGIS